MQLDSGDQRPSPSASEQERLPVNPRRRRVPPEQRKRVSTACNNCNIRRVKCSGGNPCKSCFSINSQCIYPTPVEKVHISRTELEELKRKLEVYEKALQETVPDPSRRQELLGNLFSTTEDTSSPASSLANQQFSDNDLPDRSMVKPEQRAGQGSGRLLQDPEGTTHYLGETSGATFLDHLKEVLGAALPLAQAEAQMSQDQDGNAFLSSLGRYYTDDSRPLVEGEVNPVSLPSGEDLAFMLENLRHVIQDGSGQWPSGGIYWWGDMNALPDNAATPPAASTGAELQECRQRAFYHAALAIVTHINSPANGSREPSTPSISESYFSRAASLSGNPLDITRYCTIGDVATLSLMAFYLVEINRWDAAYMHVAAAMHICIMLGVHRGLVDERGKRVFWTVYIMDRWMSCLMGRPPIITDEAIRLDAPVDVMSMPPAVGLKANVDLSRISGYVVCNTYRVAPWEEARGEASRQPDKAIWMLQQWQSTLPPLLQLSPDGLSNDPACCLLHMRYNMLIILAIRPLFLSAVKKSVARYLMLQPSDVNSQSHHLKFCIAAARRNIRLGRHMRNLDISRKVHLQAESQFIFDATVCLILEDLISEDEVSPEEMEARTQDIAFGIDMEQQSLRLSGSTRSTTLQQLRLLVDKLTGAGSMDLTMTLDFEPQMQPAMSMSMPDYTLPPRMQIGEDHELYGELMAWVDDEWPMQTDSDMFTGFSNWQ
ncbi:hypothetical protein PT974_01835 [Cladobotryum mycophilum]|uniref:Zn(2)-C6 fungal-type domain-containing protein n=1 Tax=Cladobotryum mycophilum TaxID=491253 RepID=A0ABR0SXI0_9HYPO